MFTRYNSVLTFAFAILMSISGLCQDQTRVQPFMEGGSFNPILVSAATSQDQVRFTALALAQRIRLEIMSQAGEPLYDSDFHAGNFLEWQIKDQQGSGLGDGSYGCLVTVEDLYGQISYLRGVFQVRDGKAAFQEAQQMDMTAAVSSEEQESPTILRADETLPVTLALHDENGGRIESGQGNLDFHAGTFFTTEENKAPHMRLTPDGNLGIGVEEPAAKLDVAGVIKASEGIQFSDGTILIRTQRDPATLRRFPFARGGVCGRAGLPSVSQRPEA